MSKGRNVADNEVFFNTYARPLLLFLCLTFSLHLLDAGFSWDHPAAAWWQRAPELLIYPLQTVLCAAYLWHIRKGVEWNYSRRGTLLGLLFGLVGISIWVLPYLLGWIDASHGFQPTLIFKEGSLTCHLEYLFRFLRAVLVVAMVEEFFWRGYLMRWCINRENPQKVPFGTHSWRGYCVSTAGFIIAHQPQDYLAAFLFGSMTYILCIKSKSLAALVIMHGSANLLLGICAIAFSLPGLW